MNEQETLMELVETGKKLEVSVKDFDEQKFKQIEHLRELGFTSLADNLEKDFKHIKLKRIADAGYIAIPEENITAYLKRKAERYNREHEKKKQKPDERYTQSLFNGVSERMSSWLLAHNQSLVRSASGYISMPQRVSDQMLQEYRMNESTARLVENVNRIEFQYREVDYASRIEVKIIGLCDSLDRESFTNCELPILQGLIHDIWRQVVASVDPRERIREANRQAEQNYLVNLTNVPLSGLNQVAESGRAFQLQQQMQQYRQLLVRQMSGDWAERNPYEAFTRGVVDNATRLITDMFSNCESTFTEKTCDFYSSEPNTIGKFVYREVKVENYKGIPPKDVLTRLDEEKKLGLFEYYTIASVEGVKDPLLFGRLKDNKTRFFIAQWGDDITLDDLI